TATRAVTIARCACERMQGSEGAVSADAEDSAPISDSSHGRYIEPAIPGDRQASNRGDAGISRRKGLEQGETTDRGHPESRAIIRGSAADCGSIQVPVRRQHQAAKRP